MTFVTNSDPPSVSVVIPTYNRRKVLSRAIDSVLNQTYQDFELIVVDAASTDETHSLVSGIADSRVEYIRQDEDRGPAAARNVGMTRARAKYVAFQDDDDEWHSTKLEKQVALLSSADERVGFVYCWMAYVRSGGEVTEYTPTASGDIFEAALDAQPITNSSTLLVRRSALKEIGGFDESLRRGDDGDLIRRLSRRYEVDYVPEVLVTYHTDHDHARLTNRDESGIKDAINSQKVKLRKFEEAFSARPWKRARIYAIIAVRNGQIGNWRAAGYYLVRALTTAPFSPAKYRQFVADAQSLFRGRP